MLEVSNILLLILAFQTIGVLGWYWGVLERAAEIAIQEAFEK